jgi:UDP-GlcNAc:undecaprenyl-phosphate GlcNAc-1-phosphate transferase
MAASSMQLIYSFTVALFLTIALIPLLIKFSAKLQLLDNPDARKMHDRVIPRSGGLAIALGVFLPLLFLLPADSGYTGLFLGAATIVLFGYLDDRYDLHYKWKFLGQIIAVIAAMAGGVSISTIPLLEFDEPLLWLTVPLTFVFLLGATNAVNLSDGLDGLAAGTSLLSLALIAIFSLMQESNSIALVALTVAGGLLGFLRYNTFPAKIFMGDAGSQFLGYMVACLAIMVSQGETCVFSPVLPLLLLGLPILDTITVMTIRIKEKRSPFSPDRNHLHHQLISLGLKHQQAVGVIYLIQISLLTSAYFFRFESDRFMLLFYGIFSSVIIACLYFGYRKKVRNHRARSGAEVQDVPVADRRNQLLRKVPWVYKHSSQIVEWTTSLAMLVSALVANTVHSDFDSIALILAASLAVFFLLMRRYPASVARACCYSASVFVVYVYASSSFEDGYKMLVNGIFVALVLFLVLAIRMTRRDDFRLDTQDLLVLVMVLLVPQLPFDTLNKNAIGQISIQLAVLMYGCEFIIGRAKSKFNVLVAASIASLLLVGLPAITL